MKLLICTQVVDRNHDVLGFFHDWLLEFAKRYNKVTVVCLKKGEYELPENVKVFSLGKEGFGIQGSGARKLFNCYIAKLLYCWRFYKYVWRERRNYDRVFVHMNSEYVVLGGWIWRLMGKKVGLWYVHKAIPWQLRVAEKFVDVIFTASKESCNLKSLKINIVGHGIDVKKFQVTSSKLRALGPGFNIIYVGRISKIKNQELLINALSLLPNKSLKVKFIGGTIYDKDEEYLDNLKGVVKEKGLKEIVEFVGSVPNKDILKYYSEADLCVNLCPTGGVDKAVLESMASEVPVIVYNKSFEGILGDKYVLKEESEEELARKISGVMDWDSDRRVRVGSELRKVVLDRFELGGLVGRIWERLG